MIGTLSHPLTTYLVAWDDSLNIKAGVTTQQRWRKFCTRGARLHLLHMGEPNLTLETELLAHLHVSLERAFWDKGQARAELGTGGGGYTESFHATCRAFYDDALAACERIMRSHPTGQCGTDVRALMHGRTHGRTHELTQTLQDAAETLTAVDAHAHTENSMSRVGWGS